MNPLMVLIGGGAKETLTLQALTYSALRTTNPTTTNIRIGADGYVAKRALAEAYTNDHAWLTPAANAPSDYEMRFTNLAGDTGNFSVNLGLTENTWTDITSDVIFTMSDSDNGEGAKIVTFDVEIRKGSTGSALITAAFSHGADFSNL